MPLTVNVNDQVSNQKAKISICDQLFKLERLTWGSSYGLKQNNIINYWGFLGLKSPRSNQVAWFHHQTRDGGGGGWEKKQKINRIFENDNRVGAPTCSLTALRRRSSIMLRTRPIRSPRGLKLQGKSHWTWVIWKWKHEAIGNGTSQRFDGEGFSESVHNGFINTGVASTVGKQAHAGEVFLRKKLSKLIAKRLIELERNYDVNKRSPPPPRT